MKNLKELHQDQHILFLITLLAGLVLGYVNDLTKEPIRIQKEKAIQEACAQVFPESEELGLKFEAQEYVPGATVAEELGLTLEALHSRAEDAAAKPQYRQQYDFATARAVAELRVLSEYCLGFVKVGGTFVAMKGQLSEEELNSAANVLSIMGGKKEAVKSLTLADGSERALLTVKKISQTPTKYPRCSAQMAKKPL